ncbi:exo-alpha-sialidase [Streptacidiphilus jiangxiensis]|nr:exo-alpha-sialidase [Streptacidiphilus jiangxiensis]
MYHVGSRHLAASRRRLRSLAAAASAAALLLFGAAATAQAAPHRLAATAPIVNVSSSCSGQNQEVVAAADTTGDVFQSWIGCGGIGFARSTNSGASYNAPIMLSGSSGAWDPALAVAPNGTVYAAFMSPNNYPVVEASFDHGATFTQTASVKPSGSGYFGDRPYIAVAPDGTVYVTWDYGPDQTNVQTTCSAVGSCSFADGQLNAVIEKSTDGGKTFGGFTAIGPDYPTMGGFAAPLLVDPHGRVDSLYEGHPTDTTSPYAIHNGYEYFTWSNDAGTTWPNPTVQVRPDAGTDAVANWWINGSIAIDAGGTLYATWDTQSSGTDIGWLSYSTDNGATWSAPTHVTPDNTTAAHIMEVVGGPAGTAYVGWQTNAPSQGYATYLQTFTTASGLVGTPTQVSTNYGNASVWPGDTFGLATLPNNQIAVSWGSADNGGSTAEIYATTVSTAPPASDFSLAANPTSGSVAQGSSATTTIATTASGGDTESVALSASGLPAGATAAFSPSSVTAGGSSTLTVSTASSTPVGTYQITVTGTGTAHTHTATFSLTVNGGSGGGGVTNGGFETGSFSGWTTTGNAAVTTAAKHSGSYGAMLGLTTPSNTSTAAQTFTAPTGSTKLSFYYNVTCPDTVTYDWATATLKDNTTGTTTTVLAKTCVSSSGWVLKTANITAGHSYTLTLTNKDDNYPGDPTYTYYDDVTLS